MKTKVYNPILLISILSLLILGIFHLNTQADAFSITGKVTDYGTTQKPIIGATVTLKQGEAVVGTPQTTDNDGNYEFTSVTSGLDYIISVSKDGEPNDYGLSLTDLIKMRRHYAGLEPFNVTHKYISANVHTGTDPYSIDNSDLIKLRRKYASLEELPSGIWKFFSSSATLNSSNYLDPLHQQRTIINLSGNLTSQDFTAVKMGDVDNSWENQEIIAGCGIPFTDIRDDKEYDTVQIGSQCWMAENLNVGVQYYLDTLPANDQIIHKYCHGHNSDNCLTYGGLYPWDEAMNYVIEPGTQGICPDGWHLPTTTEFNTLITYLGDESVAGGKMKRIGDLPYWLAPNTGATNESGFTALGSGMRLSTGFAGLQSTAQIITSNESAGNAFYLSLSYSSSSTNILPASKSYARSVRCIKDNN